MKALRSLAADKTETHRRRCVGCELEAITLHTPAELGALGRTAALTENFLLSSSRVGWKPTGWCVCA